MTISEATRFKPIVLQEHDAEPRRLRAILDTKTEGVYILETTLDFLKTIGMTIEEGAYDE
jgi:hypothetical protein